MTPAATGARGSATAILAPQRSHRSPPASGAPAGAIPNRGRIRIGTSAGPAPVVPAAHAGDRRLPAAGVSAGARRFIQSQKVRVIDENGENLGVMYTAKRSSRRPSRPRPGRSLAQRRPAGVPSSSMSASYKYEAQKKANRARKTQKTQEIKEIKMRPNIDDHDYDVKMKKRVEFLEEGDKVKVTMRFRGREMAHQELGMNLLQRVQDDTADIAKVEAYPRMEGRQMLMVLAPPLSSSRSTAPTSSSLRPGVTRPFPTFRWPSARSPPRTCSCRAPPTFASSTSCRPRCSSPRPQSEAGAGVARIRGIGTVGDNPGLESSVGVFIDGVYRSRVGNGPDRAWAAGADRGASRPAGHLVRPQHVGGPHFGDHRPAAFQPSAHGAVTIGNYDLRRVEGRGYRAALEHPRWRESTAFT
jgi:translation initiation factor IF-3